MFLDRFPKVVIQGNFSLRKGPYMVRYKLLTTRWFNLYLHNVLRSDEDPYHDHPWSFIALILKGGYWEHTPHGLKRMLPGYVLWRPAEWLHRLEVQHPSWSLVLTFRERREWGFQTQDGWMPWTEYIRSKI